METYSPRANVEVNARERMRFNFISEEDFGDAVEVNEGVVSVVHDGIVVGGGVVSSLGGLRVGDHCQFNLMRSCES